MKPRTRSVKKFLALLLSIIMLSTTLVFTTSAETTTIDGVTYTMIHNEDELKSIANNLSGSYMLANDITLHDVNGASNWTTIDNFAGILDGNGHTIYNLTMVNPATSNWAIKGFFGTTKGATIQNLTINGSISNQHTGQVQIGAFAGMTTEHTKFINCVSNVDITFGASAGTPYAGAFAGYARNTTFENCVNNGEITLLNTNAYAQLGGICGYTAQGTYLKFINCVNNAKIESKFGTNYKSLAGGILGYAKHEQNINTEITMIGCANHGEIIATNATGGIVGYNSAHKMIISDCINTANVTGGGTVGGILATTVSTDTTIDSITISNCQVFGLTGEKIRITAKNGHAAGIYAHHEALNCAVSIDNCVNFADISATSSYASGILGRTLANTAKPVTVTQCANMGNILSTLKGDVFIAGIAGRVQVANAIAAQCSISNCYNGGTVTAPNKSGGFVGGIAGSEAKIAYTNCFTESFPTATGDTIFGWGNDAKRTNCVVITEESNLKELITALNAESSALTFRLNDGKIEPIYRLTAASSTLIGTQLTKVENGTYSVRFVSVVNSLSYEAAGYLISAVVTQNNQVSQIPERKYQTDTVYASLLENTEKSGLNSLIRPIGTYYLAQSIQNIPADANIVFTVTPYTITDNTMNKGTSYKITFENGELIQSAKIAD